MTPAAAVAALALVAAAGWWQYRRQSSLAGATDRERSLALQVAEKAGCSRSEALAAVRRELRLSPKASDLTIAKRAAYHQERERPGRFDDCNVYWDRAAG